MGLTADADMAALAASLMAEKIADARSMTRSWR
jgi:hypothetical protein